MSTQAINYTDFPQTSTRLTKQVINKHENNFFYQFIRVLSINLINFQELMQKEIKIAVFQVDKHFFIQQMKKF